MVDQRDNLKIFFIPRDRPLVWRYLNVTLRIWTRKEIIINQSKNNLFQYVNYSHDITGGLRVSLSLILPISLSRLEGWPLLTGNGALLNMVRMHFREKLVATSRENISDAT